MITTYATLKTAIADYMDRDDLTTQIPDFINLAEQRIARTIKPNGFERYATSTFTVGDPSISKPVRFKVMRSFIFTDASNNKIALKRRPYSFIREFWPNDATQGVPRYYSDYGANFFLLAPTPNTAHAFEISYFEMLQALSDTNDTNWLTQFAPDLLLYGSLIEARSYLGNDERITTWTALYQKAIDDIDEEDKRFRLDESS